MIKISKKEAKSIGAKRYFTGVPCRDGHLTERYTVDSRCVECGRIRARAKYWGDPEKHKVMASNYYRNNIVELREKAKLRSREWRKNPENIIRSRAPKKAYKMRNPDVIRAATVLYRACKNQRTPKWVDEDELFLIKEAYNLAVIREKLLGGSWHVDHIIPLQGKIVSGLHTIVNLQVIPAIQNVSKGNRFNTE
jgi:hypothetical protein